MTMPQIKLKAPDTRLFFDSGAVIRAVDRGRRRKLVMAGAAIRVSARRLLNKKASGPDDHAAPGDPPRNRKGLLRNVMFYSYDQENDSVVVGPIRLNGKPLNPGGSPVPETLEYGGTVIERYARWPDGPWRRISQDLNLRNEPYVKVRTRRVQVAPHPYMQPALDKNKRKIELIWKDAI